MTDDTTHDAPSQQGAVVRLVTLVVGSAQIIAFTLLVHLMLLSGDPLDVNIRQGASLLLAAPLVALTLPGLLLAWLGRAPRLALTLVLVAIPLFGLALLEA